MRIIPVLDLRGGVAVLAAGGRRSDYRPWRAPTHPGGEAVAAARALRAAVGHPSLYAADLDAIEGIGSQVAVIGRLIDDGARLWLDGGFRQADDVGPWLARGIEVAVVGTETMDGPDVLRAAIDAHGADAVAASLDLRDGRPLLAPRSGSAWGGDPVDAAQAARRIGEAGARRVIVLELGRVGGGGGLAGWAGPLTGALRAAAPTVGEWTFGGGLADLGECDRLAGCGIAAILAGRALRGV